MKSQKSPLKAIGFAISALAGLAAFSLPSHAEPEPPTFTFTTIDVPGATATSADRINARGQILGWYDDAAGVAHGFLLDDGTFITIDFPSATGTGAFGINAAGQIVGGYGDAAGAAHGFLLDKGVFSTIDVPGSTSTEVFGINARGQIVGRYTDGSGVVHAFVLEKGLSPRSTPRAPDMLRPSTSTPLGGSWVASNLPDTTASFWTKARSPRSIFGAPTLRTRLG